MSLVLYVFIFLLLLLILFLILKRGKFELGQNNISIFKPTEDCTNPQTLALPLIYDSNNGVYVTQVKLGNADGQGVTFTVIPDLGSSILIVSGPNCSACNPAEGIWNLSLGHQIGQNQMGTIKYGSQVTHYIPWQGQLLNYPNGGKEVNFGVIVDSQSSDGKPMNVMGLTNKPNGFLEGICGKKIITFDFSNQKLYLGEYDQPVKFSIPFVESSTGPEFIMSEIQSITINGESLPSNVVPKYAIWDTGSTDTFLSPALFNAFSQKAAQQQVDISFTNGQHLVFTSVPQNISSANLPMSNSLLIGNYWMRQYNFIIDHESMNVSIF